MKKLLALLLVIAMLLSLCACGSDGNASKCACCSECDVSKCACDSSSQQKAIDEITDEDWEAAAEALQGMNDETTEATEPEQKIYELGETIVSTDGMVEFVIDTFGYADIVDVGKCVPVEEESLSAWSPEEGKTCLYFSGTLNYVGDAKETVSYWCDAELDYNDGYIFDADSGSRTGGICLTGGDYNGTANGCSFDILTNNTKVEIAGYIVVPEIVETDVESPLLLRFMLHIRGRGEIVNDVIYQLR